MCCARASPLLGANSQIPSTSLPGSWHPTHLQAFLLPSAPLSVPPRALKPPRGGSDTHLTPCSSSNHLTIRRPWALLLPRSADLASNAPAQWPPRCPHLSLRASLAPSRALGQVWTEPQGDGGVWGWGKPAQCPARQQERLPSPSQRVQSLLPVLTLKQSGAYGRRRAICLSSATRGETQPRICSELTDR